MSGSHTIACAARSDNQRTAGAWRALRCHSTPFSHRPQRCFSRRYDCRTDVVCCMQHVACCMRHAAFWRRCSARQRTSCRAGNRRRQRAAEPPCISALVVVVVVVSPPSRQPRAVAECIGKDETALACHSVASATGRRKRRPSWKRARWNRCPPPSNRALITRSIDRSGPVHDRF